MSEERWSNDEYQFPRLLVECRAVLRPVDIVDIAASMDLRPKEVEALFDRAGVKWDEIVESLAYQHGRDCSVRIYHITGDITGDPDDEHSDPMRGMNLFHPDLSSAEKEVLKAIKESFEALPEVYREAFSAELEIEYLELIPTNSVINVCKMLNHARYIKKRKALMTYEAGPKEKAPIHLRGSSGYYVHKTTKSK